MKTAIILFSLSLISAIMVTEVPAGFVEAWFASLSVATFIAGFIEFASYMANR